MGELFVQISSEDSSSVVSSSCGSSASQVMASSVVGICSHIVLPNVAVSAIIFMFYAMHTNPINKLQ